MHNEPDEPQSFLSNCGLLQTVNFLRPDRRRVYAELSMLIGERIRELRESKNLSQGDIQKRTGLIRCYTSRIENGHTVPSIETLEKYSRALEVPLYRLFYHGPAPPNNSSLSPAPHVHEWGDEGKERRELR